MKQTRRRWLSITQGALACALFTGCHASDPEPLPNPTVEASATSTTQPPADLLGDEGGQTGSGGRAAPLPCESDCDAVVAQRYPLQFDSRQPRSGRCVPASAIDATIADDTPVCLCTYRVDMVEDPPVGEGEDDFVLGLARRRALLGEAGDSCERRLRARGLSDACLLESTDFPGCSLERPLEGCGELCGAVSAAGVAAGQQIVERLELLGASRICLNNDTESERAYCTGALRMNDGCWAAVASSLDNGLVFTEVDCDQSVEQMLRAGAAELLPLLGEPSYVPEAPDAGGSGSL